MENNQATSGNALVRKLRTQFVLGIIVLVPIGATVLILVWIFSVIDNILQPIVRTIWGQTIPGVGFGATIVLIYLVGVIASNVVGKKLISYGEFLLGRVPMVRQLYAGIKQILEGFSNSSRASFMQVVMVEFPRKGLRSIGFVTSEWTDRNGEKLLNVFIPTSPNPTTGFLEIMREEEVIPTRLTIDQAFKMVVSAGKVTPKTDNDKLM